MPSKLQKFAEYETLPNCFSFFFENLKDGFRYKAKWNKDIFKDEQPLVLELGCGKGEYTVGLATKNAHKNYVGVDIKSNRIWTGAKSALDLKLNNVAFLRSRIDFIDSCFAENEVDEIWITFPDPQPQKTRQKKRLTHPLFLSRYKKFLKPSGFIHLKTDSTSLYEYTLEVIKEQNLKLHWHTNNLYKNCPEERQELVNIKTYYEQLFTAKGEDIKYILFGF